MKNKNKTKDIKKKRLGCSEVFPYAIGFSPVSITFLPPFFCCIPKCYSWGIEDPSQEQYCRTHLELGGKNGAL